MARVINTILNMKDNMSGKMFKVSSNIKGMSKEAQRASKQVTNMTNKFKKNVDEMVNKAAKIAGIGAMIGGGLAVKKGFGEAIDLEGYRLQLETATKDTAKAGEIMKYSIDLANKTPFEGGELVSGAAKLEAMGLSATKWLPKIGDMAAATNKPFDQAIEAFIDGQAGEMERLKEFGIKKVDIQKRANEMFAGVEVINQKGQIVNQEKFNEAMVSIMEEKFVGGMEKQSNSLKGIWSTVTGVTKSALAEMVGMTSDGTIKQGSAMDLLKGKVKAVADKFTEWQNDGTIQRLSESFTTAFTVMYDLVSNFFRIVSENWNVIEFFIVLFGSFVIGIKVVEGLSIAMTGLQIAWAILNGTMLISPLGWVLIGVMALITAGYLLWKNWDTVSNTMALAWDSIKTSFAAGVNFCIDKINKLLEGMNNLFGLNINLIKNVGVRTSIAEGDRSKAVQKSMEAQNEYGSEGTNNYKPSSMDRFALGTSYFSGGPALVGERGPEIVNLPNGASVTTAADTKRALGGSNINVNLVIQGNVIGNDEFVDEVGTVIATKVKLSLANM
ncbi:MAG: hypothetical protein RR891_02770 [Clostridium sp.]